jgi:hypothetical protein
MMDVDGSQTRLVFSCSVMMTETANRAWTCWNADDGGNTTGNGRHAVPSPPAVTAKQSDLCPTLASMRQPAVYGVVTMSW